MSKILTNFSNILADKKRLENVYSLTMNSKPNKNNNRENMFEGIVMTII